MATLNTTVKKNVPEGGFTALEVTFSNSYSTGGESLTPAQLGFTTIDDVDAQIKTASAGAVANAFYDTSTNKLLAYTTTAQVGNGTDLSGVTVRLRVYGR